MVSDGGVLGGLTRRSANCLGRMGEETSRMSCGGLRVVDVCTSQAAPRGFKDSAEHARSGLPLVLYCQAECSAGCRIGVLFASPPVTVTELGLLCYVPTFGERAPPFPSIEQTHGTVHATHAIAPHRLPFGFSPECFGKVGS